MNEEEINPFSLKVILRSQALTLRNWMMRAAVEAIPPAVLELPAFFVAIKAASEMRSFFLSEALRPKVPSE